MTTTTTKKAFYENFKNSIVLLEFICIACQCIIMLFYSERCKLSSSADDSGSDDRGQRLVCWMMQYDTGLIGHLFTLEEHRGKGLAKAVMTEMCRKVSSTGEPVLVPVAHENHPSISLCKKVGLVEIEEEFFVLRLEKKHTLICSEE